MVLFVRIDDRLIHGQVVEGWVNYLKATRILVADDRVAANALQRSIMEIAVPQGLMVTIGGVEDICSQVRASGENERAILLFSNPTDVLQALKFGLLCQTINLGGMHYVPGKRKLGDVLSVDDADIASLRAIMARGITICIQSVPNEKPLQLTKVFAACSLN
jgi:mannose/fructose/N-acetylgalactosamine-specific phosphotransferase system component IIB